MLVEREDNAVAHPVIPSGVPHSGPRVVKNVSASEDLGARGHYFLEFVISVAGEYLVTVTVDNKPIAGSPLKITAS